MADNYSLSGVLAQAGQTAAKQQQTQLDIAKLMDAQTDAFGEQSLAVSDMLQAKKTASIAEEGFKAKTDAEKAAAQTALSSSYADQGSRSNYWAKESASNADKAYAALDAINEKKQSNLLSDPVGYIMNQFTLPTDIATHNYYAEKHNLAEGELNRIVKQTTEAGQMANMMQQSTSAELAASKLGELEAQARGEKAKILGASAGTRMAGLQILNQMDVARSDLAFKALGAINADAHLKIAQQSAADTHAMRLMQQEEFKTKIDAKIEAGQNIQAELDSYNVGARIAHRPEIGDVKTFQRVYQSAILNKNQDFMQVVAAGQEAQLQGGNKDGVGIAKTAGETAGMYSRAPGALIKTDSVAMYMSDTFNKAKLDATAPKDPTAFAAKVSETLLKDAKAKSALIKDNEPNIYAAPPVGVMMQSKAGQQIISNPFFASTVAPMVQADPTVKIEDGVMFAKAEAFVRENPQANLKVTAAGISAYYRNATVVNNFAKRYIENGLPKQDSYVAKINGEPVELSNETQVVRALMLSSNRARASSIYGFADVASQLSHEMK